MRTTDIQSELQRLFGAQDSAQGGAIVVWHDPDGSFTETLDTLNLPGVEVIREEDGSRFALKCRLNENLNGQRILLYRRCLRRLDGDWFADVEARSQSFSADYASVQLRELGAPDTPEMREALQAHRAFLAKKTNMKRIGKLAEACATPQELEVAIMAVALGAPEADPVALLRTYLTGAEDEGATQLLEALDAAGAQASFTAAVRAWTGFTGDVADAAALIQHVLLSALAPRLPERALEPLGACYSLPHATFCHAVFSEWVHSDQREELFSLCGAVEQATNMEFVLGSVATENLDYADILPCIDAVILRRLFDMVSAGTEHVDAVLDAAAGRRNTAWYPTFSSFYEGVVAAANMQRFYRDHGPALAPGTAEQVWRFYTEHGYQMDRWYRDLHVALTHALRESDGVAYNLDEDFRSCTDAMEDLYKGWFLKELARRWTGAAEANLLAQGYADGIPRQVDFDLAEVGPLARSSKRAWVIISDALRYEVASELSERLERETKGSCALGAMQAEFPSITKCGMTALLPKGSFTMAEVPPPGHGLAVMADGREAPTCKAREQAIRAHYPSGVAVRYDEFVNDMTRAERRKRVDDADVVYIYHDTIDAIGDKPATERKVFTACDEAIDEIVACVQLIVREFNAAGIVVTADHGFLYTAVPLTESEHAVLSDVSGEVVEAGRRYVVAREGATSDPLVKVALPASGAGGADALVGFAPRECMRLRQPGGGENYVHGGISLQELCVPVLRFTNKRAGSKGYVENAPAGISLVSQIDTISNSIFTLELLQENPVGGKVLPATYELFVGDAAHAPVTDTALVVADRADEDARRRVTHVQLSLKPGAQTSESQRYFLYARNTASGAVQSLRELRIRISFAPSIDFGW